MGLSDRQRVATASTAIRHVVFDPESLLLDPTPGVRASLDATAREFGIDGGRTLPAGWTPRCSLLSTLAALLGSEDSALIEAAYRGYHRHFAETGRRHFVRRSGSSDLLRLMVAGRGCRWHYLSTLGREASCALLRDHRLEAAVGSVFSSEEPSCPGLSPRLLSALLAAIGAEPVSVAVLADLPADLEAARSLGMTAVALDYGRCPREVLAGARATLHADSVEAVLRWLQPRIALRGPVVQAAVAASPALAARLH